MDGITIPAAPDLDAVAALRSRLWEAGYRPVPVYNMDQRVTSPGKQPMGEGWQNAARRDPPACVARPHARALNTGILCDGLRAVDIDVDDPDLADRLHKLAVEMLGEAPTRSRSNTRRVLLVYRAAEGEPGTPDVQAPNHSREHSCRIEVLGRGKQFVGFGLHPSGVPLQWSPSPLDTIPRADLPAITEAALSAFLEAAGGMMGAEPSAEPGEATEAAEAPHVPSPLGPSADPLDVTAALAAIPNTGRDWDRWSRIGLATWHATGGSPEGFAAWSAWSARATDGIHDPASCRTAWEGFHRSPPGEIGAGSLFHMAREALPSWRKPTEITRNAPKGPRPKPITAADLLAMDIPPRRMLLRPYLPEAGSAMVYAPRGIGKTWISLSIAYAVAAGCEALQGRAPEPRRVLFVDGEMPLVTLQERLAAIALGMGREPPAADYLQFLPADHFRDGLPDLASPDGRGLIEELSDGMALVVLDNLSSLARYKENEADGWQPLQDLVLSLRRRGTSTLLVHHAGKGGQQRGTSRREDILDTVIALRRPEEYEATEGARFHWHFEKARGFQGEDAAPFEATLQLTDAGAAWHVTPLAKSKQALAWEMFGQGAKPAEIATACSVSTATVYRWKADYDKGGRDA